MQEIDFYVAINDQGEYAVHETEEDCAERMAENTCGGPCTVFHIILTIPLPEAIPLSAEVPPRTPSFTLAIAA